MLALQIATSGMMKLRDNAEGQDYKRHTPDDRNWPET